MNGHLLELTVKIVFRYISKNNVRVEMVPQLIRSCYNSLEQINMIVPEIIDGLDKIGDEITEEFLNSAIENYTIFDDYLICLEDGSKRKSLKRYIKTKFNLSPEEYKKKWNLSDEYPMVAPAYSSKRSNLAKNQGLGKHIYKKRISFIKKRLLHDKMQAYRQFQHIYQGLDLKTL